MKCKYYVINILNQDLQALQRVFFYRHYNGGFIYSHYNGGCAEQLPKTLITVELCIIVTKLCIWHKSERQIQIKDGKRFLFHHSKEMFRVALVRTQTV